MVSLENGGMGVTCHTDDRSLAKSPEDIAVLLDLSLLAVERIWMINASCACTGKGMNSGYDRKFT